ncbi:hypothetical protein GJ744_003954 [Endocarpon pusillum]|uniref:Uncharacterized protein n=1 Tax=Endocarpon pusillum TaxID=364733 RepID=A0A8H7A755_9EURO|nr:hypothetical protein GJ744_003954 [Endocarpon pusillum]
MERSKGTTPELKQRCTRTFGLKRSTKKALHKDSNMALKRRCTSIQKALHKHSEKTLYKHSNKALKTRVRPMNRTRPRRPKATAKDWITEGIP